MPDINGVCSVFGTFEITSKPTNAASTRIAISVIVLIGRLLGQAVAAPAAALAPS